MNRQELLERLSSSAIALAFGAFAMLVIGGILGIVAVNDVDELGAIVFAQSAGPWLITSGLLMVARSVAMAAYAYVAADD